MELWIRSQSKETLLKISKVYIHDNEIFASTESEFDEKVGIYKTKERALEVLDEIQSAIEHKGTAFYDKKDDALYNLYSVYEMPEE